MTVCGHIKHPKRVSEKIAEKMERFFQVLPGNMSFGTVMRNVRSSRWLFNLHPQGDLSSLSLPVFEIHTKQN